MQPLAINLAIIFGVQTVVNNLIKISIPTLLMNWKMKAEMKRMGSQEMTIHEKTYRLNPYDPIGDSISDYARVAIQFGYLALFISALPIGGIALLLCYSVSLRGDAWVLLNLNQRPSPRSAEDIGTW